MGCTTSPGTRSATGTWSSPRRSSPRGGRRRNGPLGDRRRPGWPAAAAAPVVPYVTESLWTTLTGGESLVIALADAVRKARGSRAEAGSRQIQRLVTEIRRFRTDQGLAPPAGVARLIGHAAGRRVCTRPRSARSPGLTRRRTASRRRRRCRSARSPSRSTSPERSTSTRSAGGSTRISRRREPRSLRQPRSSTTSSFWPRLPSRLWPESGTGEPPRKQKSPGWRRGWLALRG